MPVSWDGARDTSDTLPSTLPEMTVSVPEASSTADTMPTVSHETVRSSVCGSAAAGELKACSSSVSASGERSSICGSSATATVSVVVAL